MEALESIENKPLAAQEKLEAVEQGGQQSAAIDLLTPPRNTVFVLKPLKLPKPLQI
jgi:hypothetical protein